MACYDSSECFEECATGYVKVASGLGCWDRCCPLAPPPLPAGSAPSAPGPACYEDSGCFTDCAPGFVTVASSVCWEFCCVERSQPHAAIPEHRDVIGVVVPAVALIALAVVVCAYVAGRCQERQRAMQRLDELVELPNRSPSYYDDPTSGSLLTPSMARSDDCSHSSVSMSPSSTYMVIGHVITRRAEQGGAPEPPPLSPSSSTASPPSSRPPLPPPSPPLPPLSQLCL